MKKHDKAAFDLVMKMMAIPGQSAEEGEIADFVQKQLLAAGADPRAIQFDTAHKRTPVQGEVGNMIFKLPGSSRGSRRMLMAHLDTVPICVGSQPVRKGNLVRSANPKTGLGADDRAGAAVALNAALRILKDDLPHPPLTFFWTVQEETGLQGARCASIGKLGKPQLAFNFDGGSPDKLTIGATGGYRMEINIHGIASHAGGAPERGVSAIAIAALAIADLQRSGWHGDICKNGKHGTSNVGILNGGHATNVVTDHVFVKAEARSHDAKFRQKIIREMESAFQRAAKELTNVDGKRGNVVINGQLDYDAFSLSPEEPCVTAASEAVAAAGLEPNLAIANGGVDANWMVKHGIPTVTIGAGQLNQHMVSEALDIQKYLAACDIGLRLATTTT